MREIKLVNPDARPDEIKGEIGVSARFDDENLQRAVAERLGNLDASAETVHDDARDQKAEERIESIAGKAGVYRSLDRSLLVARRMRNIGRLMHVFMGMENSRMTRRERLSRTRIISRERLFLHMIAPSLYIRN